MHPDQPGMDAKAEPELAVGRDSEVAGAIGFLHEQIFAAEEALNTLEDHLQPVISPNKVHPGPAVEQPEDVPAVCPIAEGVDQAARRVALLGSRVRRITDGLGV